MSDFVDLNGDEEDALEELSNKNDFWQSLYDGYIEYGHLTQRQYAKLVEEMEK